MRGIRPAIALGLSAVLGGCSLLPFHWERPRPVEIRAVQTGEAQTGEAQTGGSRSGNAYYDRAVAAISRRDYALALDLLQRARARGGDDIRVLNAFGVVYDKLGRFDLSSRYYAQALQLDPASTVLAQNLAWSRHLQNPAEVVMVQAAPEAEPVAPAIALAAAGPLSLTATQLVGTPAAGSAAEGSQLVTAAAPAPATRPTPGILGRPLDIENASGRPALGPALRRHLAGRGWTPPVVLAAAAPTRARTVIRFPEARRPIAQALSRTLPGQVELTACVVPCEGVRLIIGADARTWSLSPTAGRSGQRSETRS